MWDPVWYMLTGLSLLGWLLGLVAPVLPTIAAALAIAYWIMKHWENITGRKVANTRWAQTIKRVVLGKPKK